MEDIKANMNNNVSLSQSINVYIEDTVGKYIRLIATKYNLDYDDLLEEWTNKPKRSVGVIESKVQQPTQVVKTPTPQPSSSEYTSESLMKLTKQELQEKCKQAGVRSSGTKNDLVKFLIESKSQTKINTIKTKPPPFVAQILQQEEEKTTVNRIVRKVSTTIPVINIRRNKFNNYEDINTGFVFDNLSKKVIGKQNADGTVSELSKEDINICNKYKFQFVLPSNLDKNSRVEDVKVDELEEEEGEGDDEIVVEEEVEVEGEVDIIDEIDEGGSDIEDDDVEEELLEEDVIDDE